MNNLNSLQEIARAIRNLIRTGIVTDVDLDEGLCRVQTAASKPPGLTGLPVAPVALACGGLPPSVSRCYCWPSAASSIPLLCCRAFSLMTIPRRLPRPMRFMSPFLTGRLSSTSPKSGHSPCPVSKPPTSPRQIPLRRLCRWYW